MIKQRTVERRAKIKVLKQKKKKEANNKTREYRATDISRRKNGINDECHFTDKSETEQN